MRKGYFMGKTNDPAKIIKKLEEKIEKLEAQIEESPKKGMVFRYESGQSR